MDRVLTAKSFYNKVMGRVVVFACFIVAVSLSACAKPAQELKVYWPPVEPKMEWITTFATPLDFEKTEKQEYLAALIGEETSRGFTKPIDVVADGHGRMYVSDLDVGEVWVIDFNTKTMESLTKTSVGIPIGLAMDKSGLLYVADAHSNTIKVLNSDGSMVRSFGTGDFLKPGFIAINDDLSRVYVSDPVAMKIVVFDLSSGEKLFVIDGVSNGGYPLYTPLGLAIDEDGAVYVAEQRNARIQVFDADGRSLRMFGQRGTDPSHLDTPRGIAFDSQENLFIADNRKSTLIVVTKEGVPLTTLGGQRTTNKLGFVGPTGVYVDRNDRLYIADTLNRRVTIWQMLTPEYLAEHPIEQDAIEENKRKAEKIKSRLEKN